MELRARVALTGWAARVEDAEDGRNRVTVVEGYIYPAVLSATPFINVYGLY